MHLAPETKELQSTTNRALQSGIARLERILTATIKTKEEIESEVLSLTRNLTLFFSSKNARNPSWKQVFSFDNTKQTTLS